MKAMHAFLFPKFRLNKSIPKTQVKKELQEFKDNK